MNGRKNGFKSGDCWGKGWLYVLEFCKSSRHLISDQANGGSGNRSFKKKSVGKNQRSFCGGEGGIRTPGTLPYNGFQDHRIRPLCHFSAAKISFWFKPHNKKAKECKICLIFFDWIVLKYLVLGRCECIDWICEWLEFQCLTALWGALVASFDCCREWPVCLLKVFQINL